MKEEDRLGQNLQSDTRITVKLSKMTHDGEWYVAPWCGVMDSSNRSSPAESLLPPQHNVNTTHSAKYKPMGDAHFNILLAK